jgi:hypothetical protein
MKELADRGGAFAEMLMEDGLNMAMAWEMLHRPETRDLNTENYLSLCKAAGYTESESQHAAKQWALNRQRANLPA